MRKQKTHCDKAFKENAVKLSFERNNVSELAQELGVEAMCYIAGAKNTRKKDRRVFLAMEYRLLAKRPRGLPIWRSGCMTQRLSVTS